jgi:multicomponent Na+:H+ antiporter subunit D
LFALGAVGLVGLPYIGSFLGHSLIDEGAAAGGRDWVAPLVAIPAAVSSGAILRVAARVFLGWGAREDPLLERQPEEEPAERDVVLPMLIAVAGVAVVVGLAVSVVPGLQARTESGSERFRDRVEYARQVLDGKPAPHVPRLPYAVEAASGESIAWGLASGAIALATAALGLWYRRVPRTVLDAARRVLAPPVAGVKAVHSGIVGDYVMWITVGTALLGGVWMLTLR